MAIDVVRQQRLWSLASDVEHVLAHRDVRDWYVFEAASWALAEQRMPAERRRDCGSNRCPRPSSPTGSADVPLFASVSVDELFRIACIAGAARLGHGADEEGATPETIHFSSMGVVDAARPRGATTSERSVPLGFAEALEGAAVRRTTKTTGRRSRWRSRPMNSDAARGQHRTGSRTLRRNGRSGRGARRRPVEHGDRTGSFSCGDGVSR